MGMSGADLIRAERYRQIAAEGFSAKHDAGHERELIRAAEAYLIENDEHGRTSSGAPGIWPWAAEFWKPTTRKRDLIKAGALIAAALDAILAAEPVEMQPSEGFRR